MKGLIAYLLAKKYTDSSLAGAGALKGVPCQIQSVSAITGGHRVTFLWEDNEGTSHTSPMDVMDGTDGTDGDSAYEIAVEEGYSGTVEEWLASLKGDKGDTGLGVKAAAINNSNHLILTFDDNTVEDAGEIKNINTSLDHITDISIENLEDGQILKYNATTEKFENVSPGSVDTNLEDLNDVDFDNLSDGQMIVWVAADSKWKNVNLPTIDATPTENSTNAVQSGGVYSALSNKQDSLTFDNTPTENSNNPVKSGGVYTALSGKQDTLTFDNAPTENSNNPVKSGGVYTALSGKVDTTDVGAANGVAELDANGKVPSSQLPSYVDDIIEGYLYGGNFYDKPVVEGYLDNGVFYEDAEHTTPITGEIGKYYYDLTGEKFYIYESSAYSETTPTTITGETGKIYTDLATERTYRWSGTVFVEISESLALGETSSTAYPGNKGKANADAITAIKDGTSIDSFADVETALGLKADKSEMSVTDGAGDNADKTTIQLKAGTSATVLKSHQDISNLATNDLFKDTVGWTKRNVYPLKLADIKLLNTTNTTWNGNVAVKNGVTYTIETNADGYVTGIDVDTDGQATSQTEEFILTKTANLGKILPDGDFIYNGCPEGGENSYALYFFYYDTESHNKYDRGNGIEITIDNAAYDRYNLSIQIAEGITLNHKVFYPMIRRADIADSTFEPYHDSVDETLHDYEVVDSENLFNNIAVSTSMANVDYTVNKDKTVLVNGSTTSSTFSYLYLGKITITEPCIVTGAPNGSTGTGYRLRIGANDDVANGNGTFVGADYGDGYTIQTPGIYKLAIYVGDQHTACSVNNKMFKPMVSKVKGKYKPYFKALKDSMFRREEQRILGAKNLNRGDATHTYVRGSSGSDPQRTYQCPFALPLVIGDKYTVSFDIADSANFDTDGGISMRFWGNNGASASEDWGAGHTDGHYEHTFTITASGSDTHIFYLYVDQTETNASATLKVANLMIRLASDPDNTYVPYAMTNKELTEGLLGKADKVASPTNNNLLAMDANGNPKDSGYKVSDFVTNDLNLIIPQNAGSRNSVYRGQSLGTAITAEQLAAIAAGTFDGMFIGDYWTIDSKVYRIADFDYWLHTGNTECTAHHVVVVPDENMYTAKMNASDVTTGGYASSAMRTANLADAKTTIKAAFGAAHVLSHKELFTKTVTDGKASAWDWYDSDVDLMNECMVYGHNAWGSHPGYETGIDKDQLALFRLNSGLITNRAAWWLRDVVSSANFAHVNYNGSATCISASTARGVRPAFAIC